MKSNGILVSQLVGSLIAFVLSFCIIVPISLHKEDFAGHCLLFSSGVWRESDGQFVVQWASRFYCNFAIVISLFLGLTSLIQAYKIGKHLYKGTESTFLASFFDTVISLLLAVITLTGALIITLGFFYWCNDITQRFEACEDAEQNNIDKADGIDTSNFFTHLTIAQYGAWMSMVCWVGIFVCSFIKLVRHHAEQNLRASMARERRRLFTEGVQEVTDTIR
ncbi:transmembrane protein 179-like [Artemia franciscana]|uniref:transmembrane protein 179-like n=1 Tax=Artemia franciscana TaxID=6661 RepID=UPI0032DAECAE